MNTEECKVDTRNKVKIYEIKKKEDPIIGVKQLRLKLARPKRKLGHRQRPEASVFIEDEPEVVFTEQEIKWQIASLDEDDTIPP